MSLFHLSFKYRYFLLRFWPFLLSIAMLGSIGVFNLFSINRLQDDLESANQKIAAQKLLKHVAPAIDPADRLLLLPDNLPTFDRLAAITKDIQTTTEQNGVLISDVTYKNITSAQSSEIYQIEITMHLKGPYQSLKIVIANLLALHSELALAGISVQRKNAAAPIVEAELRLNFYYRNHA